MKFSPQSHSQLQRSGAPFGQKENNCSGQYVRRGGKVK
jgi:hypothetical protein